MTDNEILAEARNVFQKEINGLQKARNSLNESFANAARILLKAEKVIVCGLGKSGIVGQKIAATLTSVGKTAISIHPVEALHGDIGAVAPQRDAAIFLSNSGTTAELLRLLPYMRRRGAKVVAIVGAIESPLARLSDVALDCSVSEEAIQNMAVPTASSATALAMGDALAIAVMKLSGFAASNFAETHPLGQIGKNLLMKVEDIMHSGDKMPVITPEASFRDALIEMTSKGLGCACVIEYGGSLAGIITDGDVRRILQRGDDITNLRAADCMTANPVCIAPEATLGQALAMMENRRKQIGVLAVVDSAGNCAGIARIHDIVRADL